MFHQSNKRRVWIVGNGPSLNETPLELLNEAKEEVWVCNRITLLYEMGRKFRPSRYFRPESRGDGWETDILLHVEKGIPCYLRSQDISQYLYFCQQRGIKMYKQPENLFTLVMCMEHVGTHGLSEYKPEAWHLPQLCAFGGAVGVMMQIAVLEGYNQICLVGCDLGYTEPIRENDPRSDPNHFHPDYKEWDHIGSHCRNETCEYMHKIAKRACDEKGIEILNCGIDGYLNVYPRYNIEEILWQ